MTPTLAAISLPHAQLVEQGMVGSPGEAVAADAVGASDDGSGTHDVGGRAADTDRKNDPTERLHTAHHAITMA